MLLFLKVYYRDTVSAHLSMILLDCRKLYLEHFLYLGGGKKIHSCAELIEPREEQSENL